VKDVIETRLQPLVCDPKPPLTLVEAQRMNCRDWVATYSQYVRGDQSGSLDDRGAWRTNRCDFSICPPILRMSVRGETPRGIEVAPS
jgi:hypothetical protein